MVSPKHNLKRFLGFRKAPEDTRTRTQAMLSIPDMLSDEPPKLLIGHV